MLPRFRRLMFSSSLSYNMLLLQGRSSVAEQRPFKPLVVGSTPTAPTIHSSGR